MANSSKGTQLSKIARKWADEIDEEFELVASILYRWQRGDFFDKDQNLSSILSSVDSPSQAPPTPPPVSVPVGGKTLNVPARPVTAKDYLDDDIEHILESNNPHVSYDELREFCDDQDISPPDFLSATAPAKTVAKTTPRELGKLNTNARRERMWKAYQKVEKEHPDKPASWIANKLATMHEGQGYSPESIRKIAREAK